MLSVVMWFPLFLLGVFADASVEGRVCFQESGQEADVCAPSLLQSARARQMVAEIVEDEPCKDDWVVFCASDALDCSRPGPQNHCKKACGLCGASAVTAPPPAAPVETEPCEDDWKTFCSDSDKLDCSKTAQQEHCKKSCGLCGVSEVPSTLAPSPPSRTEPTVTEPSSAVPVSSPTSSPSTAVPVSGQPSVPTTITPENQGRCYEGKTEAPDNVLWYTWWIDGDQRCTSVYIPPDAPKPMPVMLEMSCYSNDRNAAGEFGRFPVASFILSTSFTDAGGKGAWRTGNDGVVNDGNPQPCSEADTPEIKYLKAVFNLITENPDIFDSSRIYTWGFSQNSMFAAYVGFCFSDLVAGIVQGGSGLVVKSEAPRSPPNKGGYCRASDFGEYGHSCTSKAPCDDCEYWPIYPCYEPRPLVHCSFIYQGDMIGYPTQEAMYKRTSAEGFDSRMFEFANGSHLEPKNSKEWYAGCLGLTEPCSDVCVQDFADCVAESGKDGSDAYTYCSNTKRLPASCEAGCSPTKDMLYMSEAPVAEHLSQGAFGAVQPKLERSAASLCEHAH